jgi:hypothetical protein
VSALCYLREIPWSLPLVDRSANCCEVIVTTVTYEHLRFSYNRDVDG